MPDVLQVHFLVVATVEAVGEIYDGGFQCIRAGLGLRSLAGEEEEGASDGRQGENLHGGKSDANVELRPPIFDSKAMRTLRILPGFMLLLSLAACQSAPDGASIVVMDQGDQASVAAMRSDVEALTSDQFEGRETGQPGAYAAGEWLAGRMASLGLVAAGDSGFFQMFRYKPHPPMQVHGDTLKTMGMAMVTEVVGKNVLGATASPADSASGWGSSGAITTTSDGAMRTACGVTLLREIPPCTRVRMTTRVASPWCWSSLPATLRCP